jgi:hypothetical protein
MYAPTYLNASKPLREDIPMSNNNTKSCIEFEIG